MAQIARPISTISTGSWLDDGPVDNDGSLHTSIDEVSLDHDFSFIEDAGANTTCEVRLDTLTDPGDDTNHVLHVWFRSVGAGGPERLSVYLMQDTTEIDSLLNQTNRFGSYADMNWTLTAASSITDYTNLRVRMTASNMSGGELMRVTQVYLEIPDAATFNAAWSRMSNQVIGVKI